MNVVFRVDSSAQMGTGHVMRCITLAQALKENGVNVEFICRRHKGSLIDKILSNGFNVYELVLLEENESDSKLAHSHWLGATQQQDADDCTDIFKVKKIDWLIVDHYALDEKWHKILKPFVKKIMVIDDLADRQFDCNVLLNQNLGSQKENYKNKVPNNYELLLGCDYALLRSEFAELREKALEKRRGTKKIKNILISMGGSDVNNITYDILQNIGNIFNIVVVLGKKSPHNQMLEKYVKNKKITIIIDVNNMAELMLDADLAIGAGGSTSWERCCLSLPTLLYITADNQRAIAENLEKIGAVKIVKNLKKDLQSIVDNFSHWRSMSQSSSKVCDGLGANRVVKYLQ
jgi:UDP-2,4-diacetamido-2,4,6-trideoxy-beta-L-altropyranose hydrolase